MLFVVFFCTYLLSIWFDWLRRTYQWLGSMMSKYGPMLQMGTEYGQMVTLRLISWHPDLCLLIIIILIFPLFAFWIVLVGSAPPNLVRGDHQYRRNAASGAGAEAWEHRWGTWGTSNLGGYWQRCHPSGPCQHGRSGGNRPQSAQQRRQRQQQLNGEKWRRVDDRTGCPIGW